MFVNKYLMAMRFADILAQLLKILEVAAGRDGGRNMRKDSGYTRAEKRFDALMDGAASRRVMKAMDILAA